MTDIQGSTPPAAPVPTPPSPPAEPTPAAASRAPLKFSFLDAVKEVIALGAVVGSLLYVVLSLLYDRFYGQLGLHPEDLGLNRGAILSRAAAGLIAIVGVGLLCVVPVAILAAVIRLLKKGLLEKSSKKSFRSTS